MEHTFWWLFLFERCGVIGLPPDSPCHVRDIDLSLPYPKCCPDVVCPSTPEPEPGTEPETVPETEPEPEPTKKPKKKKCNRKPKCDCDCDSDYGFWDNLYSSIFGGFW